MARSIAMRAGALAWTMVIAGVAGGCCSRGPLPTSDKIESFAVIGFFEAPRTVVRRTRVSAETGPFTPIEVWVYLSVHDDQARPLAGREVMLSVVDGFGKPADGPALSATAVKTNERGLNEVKLVLDPRGHAGVFRVRADYDDKMARAIGYSPPLIVLTGD